MLKKEFVIIDTLDENYPYFIKYRIFGKKLNDAFVHNDYDFCVKISEYAITYNSHIKRKLKVVDKLSLSRRDKLLKLNIL